MEDRILYLETEVARLKEETASLRAAFYSMGKLIDATVGTRSETRQPPMVEQITAEEDAVTKYYMR